MDLYGRLLAGILFPAFEAARGRPTRSLLRELERTQWASRDELHALQSRLLRRLARHAYRHTDHYRKVFDRRDLGPEDIGTPEDLAKLPLLDKDEARNTVEARTSNAPPYAVVHKATSGSTGQPMILAYNAESRHYRDATRWRAYGWAGYRIGKRALHYWGFGAIPPVTRLGRLKVQLHHRLKRDHYIDCTPRGDAHLSNVVAEIERFHPEVIVAYAQAVTTLARFVLRTGNRRWGDIPILCGAEPLLPPDREVVQQAFGPSVFDTYGAREFMLMASECEAHDGLHTSMETMIVELVVRTPDGAERPARPGETGEVVITDLHNLAMPHIRYVNGDLAVQRDNTRCSCGRNLPRIGPIEGRVTDTLRDRAGNKVNGLVFNILMVSIARHVQQFQVVQHANDDITLKIVPNGELPDEARALVQSFSSGYLPGIPVSIEIVEDLPPNQAGKRRPVVVECPRT